MGAEREADLIPLFPILLALLPGLELNITMIGPSVFEKIPVDSRRFKFEAPGGKSKLAINLVTGIYKAEYLTGDGMGVVNDGKPDVCDDLFYD